MCVSARRCVAAFQRANPTHGQFGDQKPVKHLPGCLQAMIEDEILPRARKDTSTVFRETVMTELSVLKVLDVRCCSPRDSNARACACVACGV